MRSKCPIVLLLHLLVGLIASVAGSFSSFITNITFHPPYLHGLPAGEKKTVVVTVNFGVDAPPWSVVQEWDKKTGSKLYFESDDDGIAGVVGDNSVSLLQPWLDSASTSDVQLPTSVNYTFDVAGVFIGKTKARLYVRDTNRAPLNSEKEVTQLTSSAFDVWVQRGRSARLLNTVFVSCLAVLILVANVMLGCQLDLHVVMDTLKRPIAPMIGFCTQFVLMPLIAFGIASVILLQRGMYAHALGLFITGCAPGGGASNFWTILLDGNVDLSITMTFISTLASLGMMPLWLWLLGDRFIAAHPSGEAIRVPYFRIVISLFTLVVPLIIGIIIKKKRPQLAEKFTKALRPFVLFVIIFIVGFGIFANTYMFYVATWPALISGLLLPWCGFTFGCFTSIVLRQPPPNVTAIAVETGIQNTGIAIMLLMFSFSQPDADISAVVPVIVAIFTPFPLLTGVAVHCTIKWLKKRNQTKHQQPEEGGGGDEGNELSDMSRREKRLSCSSGAKGTAAVGGSSAKLLPRPGSEPELQDLESSNGDVVTHIERNNHALVDDC